MSTSGLVNTTLRIRNSIIRSVVTSTSKTISTNISKYGHWILNLEAPGSIPAWGELSISTFPVFPVTDAYWFSVAQWL